MVRNIPGPYNYSNIVYKQLSNSIRVIKFIIQTDTTWKQ